ncbi:hypothetical protein ODJ79_29365 [Actinoplanes sp. KI2]|uniref:hypothetical protein n=1 Tax=Actinoplanes sp. KI2 TaxID=2983315 RepID=UPI0021D5F8B7|nr:hypothetical protein [Actinoplanes sp. KI2]MCU7727846.1 hypothetical protein [Actinoplanes sp. KI2]
MTRFRARGLNPDSLLLLSLIAVAALLRFSGRHWVAGDFSVFIQPWSRYIAAHGYFAALSDNFADYNVPYLYLLTLLTWLHTHTSISLLYLVKGLSMVFDVVLAYYAARIVGLRWADRRIAALGGLVVLLLPTVVINSSYWAQCDSIYTAFTVAGLYYLLRDRLWLSMLFFGLAIAFKLQAIFVFPLLLVLLLAGRIKLRHLTVIPAVYLTLAIPAWLAGRPLRDLVLIYADQSAEYQALSKHAPTLFAFIKPAAGVLPYFRSAGVLFTAAAVLVLAYVVVLRRIPLDRLRIVLLATTYSILVPFLLPGMHERYFMQAEVLTVIAALYLPRKLWPVPLLVQVASLMCYVPYFLDPKHPKNPMPEPVNYQLLAVLMLAALLITGANLLRPDQPAPPRTEPAVPPRPEPAAPPRTEPAARPVPEQRSPETTVAVLQPPVVI